MYEEEHQDWLQACEGTPIIIVKNGLKQTAKFTPTYRQKEIAKLIDGDNKEVRILKGRQEGVTTLLSLFAYQKAAKEGKTVLVFCPTSPLIELFRRNLWVDSNRVSFQEGGRIILTTSKEDAVGVRADYIIADEINFTKNVEETRHALKLALTTDGKYIESDTIEEFRPRISGVSPESEQ